MEGITGGIRGVVSYVENYISVRLSAGVEYI